VVSPRTRRRLIVAGIVVVVLGALVAWRLAPERVPVRVVAVERGLVEEIATNSRAGTVEARRRAKISPDQGGRVAELPRRRGDRVRAGEVLLRLDDSLERGQVAVGDREHAAARAERERACLAGELARRELERNRELARQQIIAHDLLDRLESAAREAEAACAAARAGEQRAGAALELARTALGKRTVTAPFDGILAELSTEVGEWVTPAPPAVPVPPVLDLVDPESIHLALPMDEVDAARLSPGLPVRATVDSHPGATFAGRVARVAPYVLDLEAQNRTVEIEVELDDVALAARLLPGTSADVEVILERRDGVPRLPTASILAGDRILVVVGDRLEARAIERGLSNWEWTEVRGGAAEGERAVAAVDDKRIRAGARVEIVTGEPGDRP
jgi:HlyD family secretion protein